MMRWTPGTPVQVAMTKWGDQPHWRYAGYYLGEDESGDWLGFPDGTPHARPGLSFHTETAKAVLVPRTGGHLVSCYGPGLWCEVYVDITSDPVWDATTLRAVDLDLDVIRLEDGTVYVDDEDEFAEHQVRFGYPAEVIDHAEASCAAVLAAVRASTPPYDGSAAAWLQAIGDLAPIVER